METVGSIKPIEFANAVTTIAVVGFVLCRVLSYLIPEILFAITELGPYLQSGTDQSHHPDPLGPDAA